MRKTRRNPGVLALDFDIAFSTQPMVAKILLAGSATIRGKDESLRSQMTTEQLDRISEGIILKRAVVLWTGGKDCTLACYKAMQIGHEIESLVTFVPKEAKFLAHSLELMDYQAQALDIPRHQIVINEPFKECYEQAIMTLKQDWGLDVLVTGDISEVCSCANWIVERSKGSGIEVLRPLWQLDRRSLIGRFLRLGFKAIFTCVKKPWFSEEWLGLELDRNNLERLSLLSRQTDLDISGEQGEYHTMVLDGPIFAKSIHIGESSKRGKESMMYLDIRKITLKEKMKIHK